MYVFIIEYSLMKYSLRLFFNFSDAPILTVTVHDEDESNKFHYKVIESSGFGADKFTMVRNNDGTGSLKVVQSLDYEDQLQRAGFRFRIQVNDKVST